MKPCGNSGVFGKRTATLLDLTRFYKVLDSLQAGATFAEDAQLNNKTCPILALYDAERCWMQPYFLTLTSLGLGHQLM